MTTVEDAPDAGNAASSGLPSESWLDAQRWVALALDDVAHAMSMATALGVDDDEEDGASLLHLPAGWTGTGILMNMHALATFGVAVVASGVRAEGLDGTMPLEPLATLSAVIGRDAFAAMAAIARQRQRDADNGRNDLVERRSALWGRELREICREGLLALRNAPPPAPFGDHLLGRALADAAAVASLGIMGGDPNAARLHDLIVGALKEFEETGNVPAPTSHKLFSVGRGGPEARFRALCETIEDHVLKNSVAAARRSLTEASGLALLRAAFAFGVAEGGSRGEGTCAVANAHGKATAWTEEEEAKVLAQRAEMAEALALRALEALGHNVTAFVKAAGERARNAQRLSELEALRSSSPSTWRARIRRAVVNAGGVNGDAAATLHRCGLATLQLWIAGDGELDAWARAKCPDTWPPGDRGAKG